MKHLLFILILTAILRADTPEEIAKRVVTNEEAVLKLTPGLKKLANQIAEGLHTQSFPAEWKAQLKEGSTWQNASFGTLSGTFNGPNFVTLTKFEGLLTHPDGSLTGIKAKQKMTWMVKPNDQFSLLDWKPLAFEAVQAPRALFQEVTSTAIPSDYERNEARRSAHQEITRQALAEKRLMLPKREYADLPDMSSAYQYPSVSVVDYNCDGHDDFFITARYTEPQLFKNKGDGTFEDVSIESGLTPGHCVNFVLFADFDNDGDPDALVCRSLEPTLYYQNHKGRFENVTHKLCDLGEQFFVVSASAADLNRDGLLDVYLTTYTPGTDVNPIWKERYLPPADAAHLTEISKTSHPYFDDHGAPNLLLMNRGNGRLERAGGDVVKLWRKSYQPVWADVDNDGDDDLYVCNDFSPDSFLRNDTPKGAAEPVFTEAFKETFPDREMAFGMGASFGDYDNDGDLDLFVSNMYSKAGNRIISLVGKVDPRIKVAARGNFLSQNTEGKFHQVAKPDADETRTGWSFGGQFADFNNDGLLDIYVPCGLYSAPKEVATEVDL
ncbi:MAG: hypothetical protein ACI8UZ_002938 [Akkermansiaceae bacterium]|jgi:hypothetical protein